MKMEKSDSLRALPPGQSARIAALEGKNALRCRLMDLGLAPGAEIRCLGASPFGDPRAYRVRGTVFALRNTDSDCVKLERGGIKRQTRVALAGNPNVGKSTLFNALTGSRQHTGNWAGKTVELAQGSCRSDTREYVLTDLPGCYSLLARSPEEQVARDYLRAGETDAVVVICDACHLARGMQLALQVMELCERVLVCVNLMDEAARRGLRLDLNQLEERLGVPVIALTAQEKHSCGLLLAALDRLLDAPVRERESHIQYGEGAAMRLCADRDEAGEGEILCAEAAMCAAARICTGVCEPTEPDDRLDRRLDRLLTGAWTAFPLMLLLLAVLFYLTIAGANLPSRALSALLFSIEGRLSALLSALGAPGWLRALLCEGVWRTTAWVVAVMLPPMAIFFPLFSLLEEAGFLPRVAYNLDRPFQACRACGKQSLCMMMGLGCNAVGVTGCRIIETQRERLLAILTNALTPCNGRFPLLITLCALFWAKGTGAAQNALTALYLSGLLVLSVAASFGMSWLLSRTLLRGESAPFVMELPGFRRVCVGRVLWRALRERALIVLLRAVVVAAPAGALIWLLGSFRPAGISLLNRAAAAMDPLGFALGMDGAILLGFLLGLPANEIVLPLILMIYGAAGTLSEPSSSAQLGQTLLAQGWTAWTAGAVMLFSLFHWPCSTTLLTIRRESGSWRWTALAALLPTALGVLCCLLLRLVHLLATA
ncbi:MAG: ferrous iron transport protein B [Oscillospiraceae bacterium]|nr:ferrous iron transport protein B [Oscillospiraceae bacterium]